MPDYYIPQSTQIAGSDLSGTDGDPNRTYTFTVPSGGTFSANGLSIVANRSSLIEDADYTLSSGVVTFLKPMYDHFEISILWFYTDAGVSTTSVTLAQISADTGEVYDAVDGGTTAVTAILARAANFVSAVSGTTAGYAAVIRPLTDAMVVNQVMGGVHPVNKTIGTLSVGVMDMRSMRNYFEAEAKKAMVIKGYSLDGLQILLKDSEQ